MFVCVCAVYMHVCVLYVCACASRPRGKFLLNDNRVEMPEAHDDIQRDGGAEVISIQTQVPEATEQVLNIPLQ